MLVSICFDFVQIFSQIAISFLEDYFSSLLLLGLESQADLGTSCRLQEQEDLLGKGIRKQLSHT
jgi:hypothetical protein